MKKILNRKNILTFIVSYLLIGIIGLSFIYYGPTKSYDFDHSKAPIQTLTYKDISEFEDCAIQNNILTTTGQNPQIIFKNINPDVKSIKCEFYKLSSKTDSKYFNWNYDGTYILDDCMNQFNSNSNDYLCFRTNGRQLSEIKLNLLDENFILKDIKLNNVDLIPVNITLNPNPLWYMIVAIIDLFVSIFIVILNSKINFINNCLKYLKKKRKNILISLTVISASLILALIIEVLLSCFIFNLNSNNSYINQARLFFIAGIIIFAYLLFQIFKKAKLPVENIFLVIALTVGSVMILSAPFGHTAVDLDSHFRWVIGPSNVNGYSTEAEYNIVFNGKESEAKNSILENDENIEQLNYEDNFTVRHTSRQINLSHLPGTIIYSLGRFLNLPFCWKFNLVRFLYLIIYSIICYFAIKKLKSNKYLLATIALFPSNIFMASHITYDWWVLAFIFLGFSTFLSEAQQPEKKYKTSSTLLMSGSMFLACFTKMIYFPLLIVPYFLKKRDFKNKSCKSKHIIITTAFIILSIILFMSKFFIASNSTGDIRGGTDVNSAEQIKYILSNPCIYSITLFNFLLEYLSIKSAITYTSGFGYLGQGYDLGIFVIIMVIATVIDRNRLDKYTTTTKIKIANIIIFIALIALIPTAIYISFTAVGANSIKGCQARYLTPLLFPLLSTIWTHKISNSLSPKTMSLLIFTPICFLSFWDIGSTMLTRMM